MKANHYNICKLILEAKQKLQKPLARRWSISGRLIVDNNYYYDKKRFSNNTDNQKIKKNKKTLKIPIIRLQSVDRIKTFNELTLPNGKLILLICFFLIIF